ncbi:hypothetical protein [Prescottella subtropica]|uniref:hypothetical protein n=1 Tax=Prescottella subtropica TaxID=2545757 RepID=UPI0010F786B3|nr:hypothetical protein [Prescottella subtropica]
MSLPAWRARGPLEHVDEHGGDPVDADHDLLAILLDDEPDDDQVLYLLSVIDYEFLRTMRGLPARGSGPGVSVHGTTVIVHAPLHARRCKTRTVDQALRDACTGIRDIYTNGSPARADGSRLFHRLPGALPEIRGFALGRSLR